MPPKIKKRVAKKSLVCWNKAGKTICAGKSTFSDYKPRKKKPVVKKAVVKKPVVKKAVVKKVDHKKKIEDITTDAVIKYTIIRDKVLTMKQLKDRFKDDKQEKVNYLKKLSEEYNEVTKSLSLEFKKHMKELKPREFNELTLDYRVLKGQALSSIIRRITSVRKT